MKLMQEAIYSKEKMEALAFSIMVKQTFTNSTVNFATVRKMKTIFGIGQDKLARIIKNGIGYGYFERRGKDLFAKKLKGAGYHYTLTLIAKNASITATTDELKSCNIKTAYKIKRIEQEIRDAVLLNHISKQTDCVNTQKEASLEIQSGLSQGESYVATKKRDSARAKIKKYGNKGKLKGALNHNTLSHRTIMNKFGFSKHRSIYTLRRLQASKDIKCTHNFIDFETETGETINPHSITNEYVRQYKENGGRGYLTLVTSDNEWGCKVAIRIANSYTYTSNKIAYLYN